jgi:hypothetical protein
MTRRFPLCALAVLSLPPSITLAQLRVDPRLIAEAGEVWAVVAQPNNPVWPGWNASDTPILFYLPGEQDVLINHPQPPDGFVAYDGPIRFPGGRIVVKNGPTIIDADGQNTSRDVAGVRTLVVADPLSNLRQQVRSLLDAPRPVTFTDLATDPYEQLRFIVHEAFHVFQNRNAAGKGANETALRYYPVLSADNNVGFALEGTALAAALRAGNATAFRSAALRWLAVRQSRRASLPQQAVDYENGAEFSEGLAKYAEYRLFEALQGRQPDEKMWWVQGFHGYADLTSERAALVDKMLQHMRGEIVVNNDPYGTAPLRNRLYFSGMAVAVILDRLAPTWKQRILTPGVSLTDLVTEALGATPADLRRALEDARRTPGYDSLVAAKRRLALEGRARIDTMLARIETGAGTGIIVEYGSLTDPRVALAFTPFGLSVVDSARTIYTQIPIQAHFPDGSEVVQTEATPLLQDRTHKVIRWRLSRVLPVADISRALGSDPRAGTTLRPLHLELPGVRVNAASAAVQWDGKDLRITLRP